MNMDLIKHKTSIIALLLGLTGITTGMAKEKAALKPRLVVCTDIAPADVEPDDMESMVHLVAYADMFSTMVTDGMMLSPTGT